MVLLIGTARSQTAGCLQLHQCVLNPGPEAAPVPTVGSLRPAGRPSTDMTTYSEVAVTNDPITFIS